MSSFNRVILIGRTGKDPEVRALENFKVANFSLATSENFKDKDGNKQEKTEWHNIVAYSKLAGIIEEYVKTCGVWGNFSKKPWYKTAEAFVLAQSENLLRVKFPMTSSSEEASDEPPWDYDGRDWYWWVNRFSKSYGWSTNQVAVLDIDDAVGLLQEILVDEQSDREWDYGLSEMAYEYVPSTKKSKFRPLQKPKWMQVTMKNYKPKPVKKIKILVSMLPQGFVINLDEEEKDANTSPKPN